MKKIPFMLLSCFFITLLTAEQKSAVQLASELITCLETGEKNAQAALLKVDPEDSANIHTAQRLVNNFMSGLNSIRSLHLKLSSGSQSLDEISNYISRMSLNRQALPSDCSELYTDLMKAIELERVAQVEAFQVELNAFRDEVGEMLLTAKSAAVLDTLFVRLEDLKKRALKFRSFNSQFHDTINNLSRIVSGWQDYLNALYLGDQRQAESAMRNLNHSLTSTPVVPRSKVLIILNELKLGAEAKKRALENGGPVVDFPPYTVLSVVEQIQELQHLEPALEKLDALLIFRNLRSSTEAQQGNIRKLLDAKKLIDGGDALLGISALMNARGMGHQAESFWVDPMRMKLRQYALYQLIPEEYLVEAKNSPLESLIKQTSEHMVAEGAWIELWELLKVAKDCYSHTNLRSGFPSMDNDISAIESYIHATRLEETGQLNSALSSYNSVLKKTGVYGPYEAAQLAIVSLLGERADELIADQQRISEKPQVVDPRSHFFSMRRSSDMRMMLDQPFAKQAIEQAIAEQMAVYLEKEAKAKIKESAGKQK